MASAVFVSSVIAAALVLGGSAAAVELKGVTRQVNPASDAPYSVTAPVLVPDNEGGFGVFWGRDVDQSEPSPDQLFARFYDRKLKPAREAKRFDQPIGGDRAFYTVPVGGVRLGGGGMMAVWSVLFPSTTSTRPPGVLGRAFEGGKPSGETKTLDAEEAAAQPLPPLQLEDGRALVSWIRNDSLTERAGRFIKADGSLGPANIDLSRSNANFEELAALKTGFMAVFTEPSADFTKQRVFVQVFDANGKREGVEFKLLPFMTPAEIGFLTVIGLSSGDFAVIRLRPADPGLADLQVQRFSRSGTARGEPATLAKDLPARPLRVVALENDGFLIARQETVAGGERMVFTRYSGASKQVGPSAKTRATPQLQLWPLKRLANGLAAAAYLDGGRIFVQTVKP